jgi:exodeoxyribonuclease-5
MQFSRQQNEALSIVHKRLADGELVTRMFGYAGTGKTTLAKELASGARNPLFAAFTGKAASVLKRKGCPASTIHSLIYRPSGDIGLALAEVRNRIQALEMQNVGKPDAPEHPDLPALRKRLKELRKKVGSPGFVFDPETSPLSQGCDLLVLDEVSMVDNKMARDLEYFGVPILALGDPAQLPPVGGEGYFTRGGERAADALLTKVERHDGDVIELATRVRESGERPEVDGRLVVRKVGQSVASKFDQVLVGTNKVRWAKNRKLRELAGHSNDETVAPGERIICLSNNKDLRTLNGQQFVVLDVRESDNYGQVELRLICECDLEADVAFAGFCLTCGWRVEWVPVWEAGFNGLAGETELKEMPFGVARRAMWATYGYAITVHKSQGSEWPRVLVVDESRVFRRDAWRWMYTAITRAQSEVLVVR